MIDSKDGIIGLIIGDAMGVPLEFCMRKRLMINPTTEMKGYGSHNMPKGSWSDDSSLTIATIDSIIKNNKIVYQDIATNFLLWMKEAKYTPTGKVFDIGRTCLRAISRFEENKDLAEKCGGNKVYDNGNGSLMRILPIAYYCYSRKMQENDIYEIVKNVSSITHRHEISIMGCFIYVLYCVELLCGKNIEDAYNFIQKINYTKYFSLDTITCYDRILKNNIKEYSLDKINSTGYVVDTLEASLWVLLNNSSYNDSIINAINLGNDTDTVGACTGGFAGIYYGFNSIKESWKKDLLKYEYIENLCNDFNKVLNNV